MCQVADATFMQWYGLVDANCLAWVGCTDTDWYMCIDQIMKLNTVCSLYPYSVSFLHPLVHCTCNVVASVIVSETIEV